MFLQILSVDEFGNRVFVTLKPTLINCKPLLNYKEAHKGDQYYGVISKVCKNGVYVSFYNEVCGFLPCEYMGYTADITRDFAQGQLVSFSPSLCVLIRGESHIVSCCLHQYFARP